MHVYVLVWAMKQLRKMEKENCVKKGKRRIGKRETEKRNTDV